MRESNLLKGKKQSPVLLCRGDSSKTWNKPKLYNGPSALQIFYFFGAFWPLGRAIYETAKIF